MFDLNVGNVGLWLCLALAACGPGLSPADASDEGSGESGPEPAPNSCEQLLERLQSAAPVDFNHWGSGPAAPQFEIDPGKGAPTDILAGSWLWDGTHALYATNDEHTSCFDGDHYVRSACLRVIDVSDQGPAILGELSIPDITRQQTLQVLSDGERLLVFASVDGSVVDDAAPEYAEYTRITPLLLPELAFAGPPLVVKGQLLEARLVDGLARVTVWSKPRAASVEESALEGWLPTVLDSDGSESLAVDCENVLTAGGVEGVEMVSVLTVDMDGAWRGSDASISVLRDSGLGGNEGAFFGGQRYGYIASAIPAEGSQRTARARIVRVDLEAIPPSHAGSTETPATGLDAMSEHDGMLRFHGGETISAVRSDDTFEVIGSVAAPEHSNSKSFRSPHLVAGHRVVEFKADAPPTVGSKEDVAHYHLDCAVGSGLLAGAHDQAGVPTLYTMDVSDPDAPTEVHSETATGWDQTPAGEPASAAVGPTTCLPEAGLIAVQLRIDNDTQNEEGTGWESHDKRNGFVLYDPEQRAIVGELVEPTDDYVSALEVLAADGRLVTVSNNGVMIAGLDDLETTTWLPFL